VGDIVPDRDQISQYVTTAFAAAPLNSIVALRSYYDDAADGPPFDLRYERIQDPTDLECVVDTAYRMAKAAAECPRPVVLCPPLATFTKRTAKTADLAAGLVLTVECDERAQEAKRILTAILGAPSLVVASGGQWIDPETGELHDKLHLHWVLREPATTPDGFKALRRLRELACDLVGADATSKSIVHPIRCPGSVHRKKQPRLCRIVEQSFSQLDLDEALAELEGMQILRDGAQREHDPASEPGNAGERLRAELLAGCADRIPNGDVEWAEWNKLGMAYWRASAGSDEGFAAFDSWSQKSGKYDAHATKARWDHYTTSPPDRIGTGTLVYLARQVDPAFMRCQPQEPPADAGPVEFDVTKDDTFLDFRAAVAEVNRKFFVVQMGGSVVVGTYQRDADLERETLYFVKTSDLILKYKSRKYLVGFTQRGLEIWKDLGTAWLESSMRREYDRAVMLCRGQCPADTLNLWRGWGAEPKAGEWRTVAGHLLTVICNNERDTYLYLIGLLARWVQHPDKPGEVAIVLRGEKGTGKGTVADFIKRWFRHHAVHISQPRHLTGNFNAHLADCLFLFADEVVWGGDKQGEGVLKALITERAVHIEPKNINSFQMPNRLKILMASNADWCVPVTADERRFLVLDVSSERRGDRDYFNRLHDAIEGGEAEAMLHDLLSMDLSGFSHRDVPHTSGLNGQKVEGLDSVGRWWMACLEEGRIVGCGPLSEWPEAKGWPGEVEKSRLHYAYVQHAHEHGDRHPKAENTFPRALMKFAPSLDQYKPYCQPRRWRMQGLDWHRSEYLEAMRIAQWDWPEADADEPAAENVHTFKSKF
jgi:hypothetical protein